MYFLTGINLFSISNKVYKNLKISLVYVVLKRAKVFTLELAKVVVLTLYLLQDSVHRIVKLFLPNKQLKLTSNISIPFNPKEKSSFRVVLFLVL